MHGRTCFVARPRRAALRLVLTLVLVRLRAGFDEPARSRANLRALSARDTLEDVLRVIDRARRVGLAPSQS
jgi:hypothetical protein